jgi:hypothetical protein
MRRGNTRSAHFDFQRKTQFLSNLVNIDYFGLQFNYFQIHDFIFIKGREEPSEVTIDTSFDSLAMEIDYVRIHQ